jgi:hypothetical protein
MAVHLASPVIVIAASSFRNEIAEIVSESSLAADDGTISVERGGPARGRARADAQIVEHHAFAWRK